MNKFANLKSYTDSIGSIYGTENISIYLYSLARMIEPKLVVDLGTGLGSTSLWVGSALEENNKGTLITVDDGSEWDRIKQARDLIEPYFREDYSDFIYNLIHSFELNSYVSFIHSRIETLAVTQKIDMLICDYSHGPYNILKLLANYLPKMSMNSYIFIDSASTLYSSYHTLEKLIEQLNKGIVPLTLSEMVSENDAEDFARVIGTSEFKLTHLIENKNRSQNSTAQIQILPVDIMPQPRVNIRF